MERNEMKNLKTGNYTESIDISDGFHRPQYDNFRLCKGLLDTNRKGTA